MTIRFQAKHVSGFTVDAPFEAFNFPAGEAHIKLKEGLHETLGEYEYFIADVRGYNPQDLFHLAMWSDLLRTYANDHGATVDLRLIMPYLPGARADRGTPFGAQVYADFINDLDLNKLIVLDPHSPVMVEELERWVPGYVTEFPFERIIKHEIQDATSDSKPQPYIGVIAPDKGAHNRAARAAKVMGVPVYTAGKTRDFETGKLTGFHMEDELPTTGRFLIVDDICDGGGTFIGLAEAIAKTNPHIGIDLWVTHGIFSNGFDKLEDTFETIHTTNSFYGTVERTVNAGNLADNRLVVHDLTSYLYTEVAL
jgi:ribose-phosphate pyrophosphokinase